MTSYFRISAGMAMLAFALLWAAVAGTELPAHAGQSPSAVKEDQKFAGGKLEMLHVQGNVYMIVGAGGNVTVQVGSQFVIVVDPGLAQMSDEVLKAIRSVTDKQGILYIIDTSSDADHTGGNEKISQAGWALPNGSLNPMSPKSNASGLVPQPGASILAHINVLNAMSQPAANEPKLPAGMWPSDVYETDLWRVYNDEGVFMYHPAAAHTDGDTYVLFRGSDVISTGDLVDLTNYPVIDLKRGGSINGLVDALNQMIDFMEPKEYEEGGTYIIPGHGHIGDRHDVVNYRDMVTIVRDRVKSMVGEGKTLEQVKAAKPTIDYDVLYGTRSGPWTTEMFVEAVYRDLARSKDKKDQKVTGGLK
jgi:glyoxylase-like metal-dependent hydrolase (beta-lactamase superfamily II)